MDALPGRNSGGEIVTARTGRNRRSASFSEVRTIALENSIGIVISRCVPPPHVGGFENGLRELIQIASRQPGHISVEVLRGAFRPEGRLYYIVYRFSTEDSLRAWEASPERQSLVSRLESLTVDAGRLELTGFEAWFDLPPGLPPPSRHRMAILTWIGIWPLVSIVLWFLAPHLSTLPFLLCTAVNTAVLVLAMTYLVMPWLARVADRWLQPRHDNALGPAKSF